MDDRVSYLISIGLDQSKAKEVVAGLDGMRKGLETVKGQSGEAEKALRKVAETGRQLREVGTVIAASGAAMLAPFIASAQQYMTRFKGLEGAANDYARAQQRVTDASSTFGRVAAQQLTPILNQVADFQEKVAQFASAHPELVKVAIGAGAGLVAGGGALVMAGTAISTIARAAEVLKSVSSGTGLSGVASALGPAVVAVGSLAAGAKLAEVGLNKVGEATGNAYLAHYQLSDALKTAREILVTAMLAIAKAFTEAKVTWGRLQDIITAVFSTFKVKIEGFIDGIATNFRKILNTVSEGFRTFINGILDFVASVLDKIPGQAEAASGIRASKQGGLNAGMQNSLEDVQFNVREKSRQASLGKLADNMLAHEDERQAQLAIDRANLGKLADFGANFAQTGSLGPVVAGIGKSLGDALNKFMGGGAAGAKVSGGPSPEAINAYIKYEEEKKQADIQYQQERADLVRSFNEENLKAERDHRERLKGMAIEEQKAEQDVTRKANEDKAKAQRDFDRNEAEIAEKNAFERRMQAQRDQLELSDIAASGDVSAFVRKQREMALQNKQQQQQDQFDKSERKKQFDAEQRERDIAAGIEMRNLKENYAQKLAADRAQYAQEQSDRRINFQNQLSQLALHHSQEQAQRLQAFGRELAGLDSHLGNLQKMRDGYYAQESASLQAFVNNNLKTLQSSFGSFSASSDNGGRAISRFASGSGRIPYDKFPAYLDRGEKVLTAGQADAYERGKGSGHTFNFNYTVGDVATSASLQKLENKIVNNVAKAIRDTRT